MDNITKYHSETSMAERNIADENFFPNEATKSSAEISELGVIVTRLAEDYAKYLKVDAGNEKALLDDEIEDILTRLDEFTSLLDMVRGDNALCLNQTLPEIHKKYEEMETVFLKIDKLCEMVEVVKEKLDVLEEKVNLAEEQLDSSSVKKLFNTLQKPLFSKKGSESKKHPKYEPPEIFKAEAFFPPTTPSEEKTASTSQ